ncbi:MAG: hypothetical protein HKN79_04390 [Flavobacteriales bacterium]|nr:hypothetical protein [Flavobacteriales bacterium]
MSITLATILTGAALCAAPIIHTPNTDHSTCSLTLEAYTTIAYAVSVESTTEELEHIRTSAIESGMGLLYEKSPSNERLIIDMCIVNEAEDDFEVRRVVVNEQDGVKHLLWTVDTSGRAVGFERPDTVREEF